MKKKTTPEEKSLRQLAEAQIRTRLQDNTGKLTKAQLDLIRDVERDVESEDGDPLRRLRLANAKLAELELSIREGETLETAAVQVAYAEVVGIVRSGLRALPRRIASELENQPAAVIEKAVDRMVRELADGFEKRCGEVGLVAKPKKERKGKKS